VKNKNLTILTLASFIFGLSACNNGGGDSSSRSGLYNAIPIDQSVLMYANNGTSGFELYQSNGTNTNLIIIGGDSYFTATDSDNGTELWKYSGTVGTATLVKDISPGTASSSPRNLTAIGSILYFVANDGSNGQELWKSDGTAAGTILVKDH